MNQVMDQMLQTIENGISTRGVLPGKLQLKRIAADLYRRGKHEYSQFKKEKLLLMSYAYAAAEE
jgi:L-serine dehydratase